ncbi:6-phosphofructokinase [Methanoculleus sp. FWC-SCC1]|uniref:6-phosphofructokinase n=1 Tax=Methanoculleus frigidifontis TaxID=2584085 RepID=A0ABT8M6E5_9EURY|nr:6-phosphofructokinase [Methanoculleus sp. FWC-SCC1]MDN7023507.1 6-phosphofructokinase [Methanoculleus sp. FWC-SCC1]
MKRIGVLTSGGDAPGMNACIRAVVRTALANELEVVGIRRGYAGLIRGETVPLDRRAIRNTIHIGGTILETSRSPEFRTPEGRTRAAASIEEAGLDGVVLIGGDGTFQGGSLLAEEWGIPVVGVPASIDNDVYGTDYCIGFDTAANCALNAIDRIRDTARSHDRLFFVEVMGRESGFLALESGIAGGAEELIIPEESFSPADVSARLREGFRRFGKKSAIVVVAEGEMPGRSFEIAHEIREHLGYESRVVVLGHLQRGGPPTVRDRVLGSMLGVAAVTALLDGRNGCMAGEVKGEIAYTPLGETGRVKSLDPDLMRIFPLLSE